MVFGNLFNIAKNPILRYLSRFTKNLTPEHLKLSFVKGEGELTNLELDEEAIMRLLDLPTWLKLRSAKCNRVSIRCQWTKLKKQPLCLSLDEVYVEIEALDDPRPARNSDTASYKDKASDSRYGFADKVLDGIDLCVNSVVIIFTARAFRASIQLSRVHMYSVLPNWSKGELKFTYLRDRSRDQILLFKEVVWETTRFEAGNSVDCGATLVRLITNASRIRLTMKKNLSDSRIVASRLELLLDDLLWVLTVSQLEATVLFIKSLQKSVEKSSMQSKQAAKKKLQSRDAAPPSHRQAGSAAATQHQQLHQLMQPRTVGNGGDAAPSPSEAVFMRFDILETSYHVHTGRVDLHFCEESGSDSKLSESSVVNGAIQLTLLNIGFDSYPLHPFVADRRQRWLNFSEINEKSGQWLKERVAAQGSQTDQLIESCVTLSLQDFCMGCVTTSDATWNKKSPFLASDKQRLQLPRNTVTAFVDFTEFFYPDCVACTPPLPCLYAHLNPLHLRLDFDTLIWLNAFGLRLNKNLASALQTPDSGGGSSEPLYFFAESIMPRFLIPAKQTPPSQPSRPARLEVQASCLTISNDSAGFAGALAAALGRDRQRRSDFPGDPEFDWPPFQMALAEATSAAAASSASAGPSAVWHIACQQLWCDFTGAKLARPRRQPCIDAGRVSAFLARGSAANSFAVLVDLPQEVRAALTHLQYLFLMRMGEEFGAFADCLQRDKRCMGLPDRLPGQLASVWIPMPCIRLRLLMPTQLQLPQPQPPLTDGPEAAAITAAAADSVDTDIETDTSDATNDDADDDDDEDSESDAPAAFLRRPSPPSQGVDLVEGGGGGLSANNSAAIHMGASTPSAASASPPTASAGGGGWSPGASSSASGSASTSASAAAAAAAAAPRPSGPQLFVERLGLRLMRSAHRGSVASLDSMSSDNIGDDWDRLSASSDLSSGDRNEQYRSLLDAPAVGDYRDGCLVRGGNGGNGGGDDESDVVGEDVDDPDPDEKQRDDPQQQQLLACLTARLASADVLVTVDHAGSLVRISARRVALARPADAADAPLVPWASALVSVQPDVELPPLNDDVDGGDGEAAAESPSRLRVRVFMDDARTPADPGASLVTVAVSDVALAAGLSSLTGLGDFFEDEILVPPLPMTVQLECIRAEIREDRPCTNATCPGEHPPIKLELPRICLKRGVNDVLFVSAEPDSAAADGGGGGGGGCHRCRLASQSSTGKQLPPDQREHPDSARLVGQLAKCQTDLEQIRRERDSLLGTVEELRAQLKLRASSNRRRGSAAATWAT